MYNLINCIISAIQFLLPYVSNGLSHTFQFFCLGVAVALNWFLVPAYVLFMLLCVQFMTYFFVLIKFVLMFIENIMYTYKNDLLFNSSASYGEIISISYKASVETAYIDATLAYVFNKDIFSDKQVLERIMQDEYFNRLCYFVLTCVIGTILFIAFIAEVCIRFIRHKREIEYGLIFSKHGLSFPRFESIKDVEAKHDDDLCSICKTNKRQCAFIPCGHRILCGACTKKLSVQDTAIPEKFSCLVCRKVSVGVVQIF